MHLTILIKFKIILDSTCVKFGNTNLLAVYIPLTHEIKQQNSHFLLF